MKYIFSFFFVLALSTQHLALSTAHAQTKLSPMVAIDAPPPVQPTISFNMQEVKFGGQATEVESCIHVQIINTSKTPQRITAIYVEDERNYSLPSPNKKMFPLTISPTKNLDVSVCFNPKAAKSYPSRLVVRTESDSSTLPISGKGMKPADLKKLPKNDLIIMKARGKRKQQTFKVQLVNDSKITLQLYDALGAVKLTYANGDIKKEGVYEYTFDGLDSQKKKLEPGTYYLRCEINEVSRIGATTKFTKVVKIS